MRTSVAFLIFACIVLVISSTSHGAGVLDRDQQIQIIDDFLFVMGRAPQPSAASSAVREALDASSVPHKCGMSAAADFAMNRGRLDRDLLVSAGIAQLNLRPDLPFSHVSPDGLFTIHYAKTGTDAVYRAGEDGDGDGVPNYVEATALIADSVYDHIINQLGYPIPPSDGFYPEGADPSYDIYLVNLSSNLYGLTYMDSVWADSVGYYQSTSFIVLDNDYGDLDGYQSRPLDAIRVTTAHEFFHAVQFGIDPFEAEDFDQAVQKRYWMEISSVWMEEEVYDNINDYYVYLPYFFNDPTVSLQRFASGDNHPYASGIFGVFLSERFNRDVMRETWFKCGEYGVGPHVFIALDEVLDSATSGQYDLPRAFAEFAQWNYFTNFRAPWAPGGATYEEAIEYPAIPASAMFKNSSFDTIGAAEPEHMAAAYIRFQGGLGIEERIWAAGRNIDPDTVCNLAFVTKLFDDTVSQQNRSVTEIPLSYPEASCPDFRDNFDTCALNTGCASTTRAVFDTLFDVTLVLDSLQSPWYISAMYQLTSALDSHEVDAFPVGAPSRVTLVTQTVNPERFCSYVLVLSAASTNYRRYDPDGLMYVRYVVDEIPDAALRADCFGEGVLSNANEATLIAFPNPAVESKMTNREVRFSFRFPAYPSDFSDCTGKTMAVDIFSLAGERVSSMSSVAFFESFLNSEIRTTGGPIWRLQNDKASDIASGVYIAHVRLYCGEKGSELLAENKVKVAVIR
ncbi:MAG: hypothetical protein NDJ18_09605 [candidate division Zixibacteria bacterium]|nr:hypothetical protein [candidate division Zixibacteria bacterium]